jgi:hypothetical protein
MKQKQRALAEVAIGIATSAWSATYLIRRHSASYLFLLSVGVVLIVTGAIRALVRDPARRSRIQLIVFSTFLALVGLFVVVATTWWEPRGGSSAIRSGIGFALAAMLIGIAVWGFRKLPRIRGFERDQ